jgi:glutathione S-transferase
MITLYQLPPAWGRLPSLSHFCVKLETYLRMTGLPFRWEQALPMRGPTGKVPWIDDDGTVVADSGEAIDHLKARHGDPLDVHLTPEERAHGLTLRRAVEEHTYFAVLWLRWSGEASWPHVLDYLEPMVPPHLDAQEVLAQVRQDMLESIRAQGVGRHGHDAIVERACKDLDAFSTLLGSQPFFLGDQPTSFDCSLYGVLAQVLWPPWEAPDKAHLASLPNLVGFCERIRERWWSDWEPNVC